jgi:hypothetical protein
MLQREHSSCNAARERTQHRNVRKTERRTDMMGRSLSEETPNINAVNKYSVFGRHRALEARFGDDYREYARHVLRWIGVRSRPAVSTR